MKNKIRFLAMMLIGVLLSVNQVWSGSYVLDKASLTTAKSAYQSSDYTQTATDGSKWTLNGYGITVSTYVQLGKASTNYITTPACSGDITNITITCSGSYYLAIWTTNGSLIGSCVQKCSTTGSGAAGTNSFDIPAGYKQVKIVSTRTQNGTSITSSNAATYISNIEVTYGGSTKTDYYFRGEHNSWGATKMTAHESGYYAYYGPVSGNQRFKIAKSESSWDYTHDKLSGGFQYTNITNMGHWDEDGNCGIYDDNNYYILIYYPNTDVNSDATNPKICASSELPNYAKSGKTVYFDNSLYGSSTPYLRMGRSNHSSNSAMTKVTGTASLYKFTTTGTTNFYENYSAYTVANAQGSSSDIYDMTGITKTTVHAKKDINKDITIVPTGGDTYYNYNESDGMLTHNVSIGSHTNGTIKYSYTDVNGTAHNDQTTGASNLAHTCILTITTEPDAGYGLADGGLTVTNATSLGNNQYAITGDATISATFEQKNYTVTFYNNANSKTTPYATVTVPAGSTLYKADKMPANPAASAGCPALGLKFAGWTTQEIGNTPVTSIEYENIFDSWVEVNDNMTVYALWAEENTTPYTFTASNYTTSDYSDTGNPHEYGWYSLDYKVTFALVGKSSNTKLYTSGSPKTFTVERNTDDDYLYVQADEQTISKLVGTFSATQYCFDGISDGTLSGGNTVSDVNTTLVQVWAGSTNQIRLTELKIYVYTNYVTECPAVAYATITFDTNGKTLASGSMPADITNAVVGRATTLPGCDATVTGYTFAGWSATQSGEVITKYTPADEDQTYTMYAIWQVNSHTLTWALNGGTAGTGTITPAGSVAYGTVLQYTVDPTKDGKKFNGWSPEMISGTTTMPDNDQTYTAQWRDIVWTDYLTDCGEPDTWFLFIDGEAGKSGEMVDFTKTVELEGNRNYGFKLYKNIEGDPANQVWYTDGDGTQNPGTITVDNCSGWNFKNTTPASGNTGIRTTATGNYTFSFEIVDGYPRVSVTYPTAYQVSYEANGGTGTMNPSDYCAAGGTITLATNTFEKTDYHFKGWVANVAVTIGGSSVPAGTLIADGATIQNINSNITLTAQWETKVTALTISQESGIYEIVAGETLQLTLTVTPNDAEYGTDYTWYSSNTSTMTVDQSGLVTGIQANTGDYIYVINNDGVESNHYGITVKSAACDTWGLHMWNEREHTSRDFCFTQVGSTTEWRTQQVTLPSNSDDEKLKVLYAGGNGYYSAQWITRMVPTVGYIQGGCDDASDGNRYAGQDVKGYFRIFSDSKDPNYFLAFQPVYAVMYGVKEQTWQQVEFTDTETANNFYTGIITVPEGYDSNVEIYAGTSMASGVFFINGRSSTVNMNTITGLTGSGMAGKAGKFKINDNYCNESNFNLSFIRYYRLHYNLDGGEGTGDYTDKFALPTADDAERTFTLETAPTKEGYTFRGWSVSIGGGAATIKEVGDDVTLTEDAVVTAIWAENFTVTYDLAGYSTSCSSSTVHYCGEEVTVCDDPEDKTGYTFKGWNTDDITGSPADFEPGTTFTMPCHDVVFTADYQAVPYTITYEGLEDASNTNPTSYTIESAFDFVAPGTRTGYTFTGWTENGNPITGIVAGTTGIKTITANWSLNSHNVTFNANGHGVAPTGYANVNYGTLVTKPTDPADVDESGDIYTFIGWYKEAGCTNVWNFATDVMPDNDLTLYAKWSGVTYEDYRTHCCTPLPAPETRDASNIHMTTATLSWGEVTGNNGYQVSADQASWVDVLGGTSYDLTGLTPGTPYTYYVRAIGDNNEYCQYGTAASIGFTTKAALHITYNANGGTGAEVVSEDIEEDASATVADNTFGAPTGMTFNGWNTATDGTGTAYAVGATINPLNENLTLYAQWIGATFNVTYELAGGTGDCESTTATYNSTFTICSAIPTKGTNAFTGWLRSDNSETYQPGATFTMPASDVTLTAQWTASYTVTYVINNVQVIGTSPAGPSYVAQGQPTILPDFEFSCGLYNQFIGWVSAEVAEQDEKIPCPTLVGKAGDSFTPTGNITLYALFGHDAENLGWVKQTTISSGKYIMATGTTVMTGFDAAQKSTINNGSCTSINESSTGVYNPTTVESAIQVQAILGTGGNAGKFALQYGDYYIVPDGGYLNYNVTDVANAYTWKLTDGSQVSDKDCAAGVLQNAGSTTYICQKNSSQAKYKMYTNTQGATNCVYLYKLINEGYYTTSPTCAIPTSVTVTYNKNTVDDVTMCENAELEFDEIEGYPTLAESYTLCAAANVVREGYVLRTWNTAANGTGKNYKPDTVFTELGNNLKLYAQWDRVYTVRLHDADQAVETIIQASGGAAITMHDRSIIPDEDGCPAFVGWTSESTVLNGNPVKPTIVVEAGVTSYTPTGDIDLYAVYSKKGNAREFQLATEGVNSFYFANTDKTAYASTKFSSNTFKPVDETNPDKQAFFIEYDPLNGTNYAPYTIRTNGGYVATNTPTNDALIIQAAPAYWHIEADASGQGWKIIISGSQRQFAYNSTNFGFYATGKQPIEFDPCDASTYWSNPSCSDEVSIIFHDAAGSVIIDWPRDIDADDYKNLAINTSVTQWPTATFEDWHFAGWSTVDYSNTAKYAGSFVDDTKNGTIAPQETLYGPDATTTLTVNNNYNMYPIFTKVEETTQFDEAIGGDYYIYFRGSGTRYKDAYTDLDGEYLRVYATNFDGSKFTSTAVCASAATVTFSKRADGNWNLQTKRENKTVYLTNASGNDFATQAAEPEYGWTMTKQGNGSYQIHYVANNDIRNYIRVFDDGLSAITNSTFKCYSQDQEHSSMYQPVFIGSCVERTYSSEPSNKAKLQISGAAYITSTAGQGVRSAMAYKVKGSFLKANATITLTDNAGVAMTDLALVGADGKAIKAYANGMLAETTAYVVYTPTETTDGIENREICVSALDRSDVAITSEAKGINNIHLRHLPAKFLIAQKVGADWYALPNDMSASMSNPAAAKLLSVNEATGTATIYSDVENIYAYTLLAGKASTANMGFNATGTTKTLRSCEFTEGDDITKMGLYAKGSWTKSTPAYEFAPATEDLKDYTLTNALQNADLGIADGNWVISGDQTVRFFAIDQQTPVNLTLSGDVALTSANNIEVYGNQTSNLLHISADYTNVAKLRYTYNDGTSDVTVSNSVFRLNYFGFAGKTDDDYKYADATAGTPIDVSSLTGEVDQTFSVSLKPKAANTMYNYTLTIAALDANNNVMEEKQITLKGRSLPEQFVIAMKSTNGDSWYALPNDLATSTSEGSSTKAPIMISVDNTTAPTKALMAPKNTLYKGYGRYQPNSHRNAIRFLRADATDNAWITTSSTSQLYMPAENSDKQQFNLLSSDLSAYTIRQDGATKTIAMFDGIIGWYGSSNNTVYLLPVDASAEPAVFDVVEWFPTKLLIESSQDITNTSVKVGDAEAVVGTASTITYGTNLYEVQTGDLTAKAGQAMSVSYTIETTTYAKVVTVPIILSRGKYATATAENLGGLAPSKYQYNDLVVRDGATLTVDATTGTWNKFVNVTIYPTSKVVVPAKASDDATKEVTMTTTTMTLFGGTDEIYNGSEYTLTKYGVPQLVLNGKLEHNETTSGLVYDVRVDKAQYYNFALPYTSKYELVTDNKGGEDFTFWTKVYDGATRAAGNNGWVWYNWDANPWAINIGTGYMFAAQPYSGQNYIIIRHPMGYDATENADGHRTSTAEATKAAVDVYAYPSKYANNAGWNYIANPFMANFRKDLGDGSTGTIQTGRLVEHKVNDKWDGHYEWEAGSMSVRYVTLYNNGSDTYTQLPMSDTVLAPFTGFFVQIAEPGQIVFDISGRANEAPARMLSADELPSEMEIFLHAACQGQKDDAVLFINDNLHRDNAKEFPNEMTKQENANTLNFYTFGGDEVKMYANGMSYEDAQGWSKAGVKVATAGEYTFSVASDQADYIQQVILRDMDSNTEYDLMSTDAKIYLDKGEMNDRFYVKIVFGKHNIGTGVTERYDTSAPEKFILNDHMYIRANGVLYDGVGKRVKY